MEPQKWFGKGRSLGRAQPSPKPHPSRKTFVELLREDFLRIDNSATSNRLAVVQAAQVSRLAALRGRAILSKRIFLSRIHLLSLWLVWLAYDQQYIGVVNHPALARYDWTPVRACIS